MIQVFINGHVYRLILDIFCMYLNQLVREEQSAIKAYYVAYVYMEISTSRLYTGPILTFTYCIKKHS